MLCWRHSKFFGIVVFALLLFGFSIHAHCQTPSPEEGVWRPEHDRDALFRIAPCKTGSESRTLCGWLIGLDYKTEDGPPKDFAGNSECGLEILENFTHVSGTDDRLEGRVLDPRSGTHYKASLWMGKHPDELKLRGYLGLPLFGKTVTWFRYTGPPAGANCQMAKDS